MVFQSNTGVNFTTADGKPPGCPQNVTTYTNGQAGTGYWNGSNVVKY
jgi:hypothetical protein